MIEITNKYKDTLLTIPKDDITDPYFLFIEQSMYYARRFSTPDSIAFLKCKFLLTSFYDSKRPDAASELPEGTETLKHVI